MAVQQNRKTRSKRGMRRAHDAIGGPTLTVDETSGETRRRHHVSAAGDDRARSRRESNSCLGPLGWRQNR